EAKAEGKPDNPEPSAETQPRDDQGRFQGKEQQPEGSKYEKAKKDQARLDKTWESVNKRKDELDRRERELQAQYRSHQQQQQRIPHPGAPQGQLQFRAKDYVDAANYMEQQAKGLLERGDIDAAKEQWDLANNTRKLAAQAFGSEQQDALLQRQNDWQNEA